MPKRIPLADLPPGEGRTIEVDNQVIAVFNVGGQIHAMDGICPHAGGPLGDGYLDGNLVTCPWHGWQFDVTTGACTFSPDMVQGLCGVTITGNEVEISAPAE
ncbi:MAG: Rieske (2Fe-2S) protein [Armatimonadetes bacterium]|nr:Rieske (2Fe-2S) protein [Armatimonadota bacterium]